MLFSKKHIKQIITGDKTQTRRRSDTKGVKIGNSYRACESIFTKREDSPAYVVVTDVYKERLGDLSEEDAKKEGGYTVEEFKNVWLDIHGEWNKNERVWVIEFEGYENDPREN